MITVNKTILIIFAMFIFTPLLATGVYADEHGTQTTTPQAEENILIEAVVEEEEELPIIDPFLGNTMGGGQSAGIIETNEFGISNDILNNMRLIGTIRGHYKRLAILSAPDGRAFKYKEKENITDDIKLTKIYNDFIIIKDIDNNEYEVHMNNQIKPREKKKK